MGDGDRDAPDKGVAENWSRPDHIRAGAVSGPWRSAPRQDDGVPPPADAPANLRHLRHAAGPAAAPAAAPALGAGRKATGMRPKHQPVEPAAPKPEGAAVASPEPATGEHTRPARHVPEKPRNSGGAARAFALGLLVAVTLTGAALFLRPMLFPAETEAARQPAAEPAPSPAPETTAVLAPEPEAPEPVAAEPEASPAPEPIAEQFGVSEIRVRVPAGTSLDRRDGIVAHLGTLGYDAIRVEELAFRVALSRIGYYHPDDKLHAETLADAIAPALGESRDTFAVRNYRELSPDAAPGRLDIWVKGE